VLAVGTLQPRKNLKVLIDAWCEADRSGAKLVLVGGEDKIFSEAGLAQRLDSIILTGRVSDSELVWYYRNALAFFSPSLYEGFGVPALEALKFRCPLYLSNIPVYREIFDGAAVFLDPKELGDWSAAMAAALRKRECGTGDWCSRKVILEKNSWEHVTTQVEEALLRYC
jgi:glycosyltransferase involved in cell wall biosynthesis